MSESTEAGGLGQRMTHMSAEKRALLEQRLMQRAAAGRDGQAIPRRSQGGPCPLSFSQELLWLLEQLDPGTPTYHIPKALHIRGPLSEPALQQALDALLARHEVLRTTFQVEDGTPLQAVAAPSSLPLHLVDRLACPAPEREAELQRLLKEEARRPFDLSRDQMLRATLVHLQDDEHVLLLVMHHIAADGWSMGILFRELGALYEAFVQDKPGRTRGSPLPELPIQYADYAVWQRELLQGKALEQRLSYWRERLEGAPPFLDLPTDHPRPAVQGHRGAQHPIALPAELAAALRRLSQEEGATLFMTLYAAFSALLCRYTGQEDLVVGTPIANRGRPELESLIGFFTNTLALRTDLSGNPNFRELLRRVRPVALDAYEHQDLPFEKLVVEMQPDRDLSHTPLFQTMILLQNMPSSSARLADLTLTPIDIEVGTAKFDLILSLYEKSGAMTGWLTYSLDLFEAETVARMAGHLQTLLEGIVRDPDRRLQDLPLLTAGERHQLLVEWNATAVDSPPTPNSGGAGRTPTPNPGGAGRTPTPNSGGAGGPTPSSGGAGRTVHERVAAQAICAPGAVAVVHGREILTFGELNARANRLAHALRRRGVGPDIPVAVAMERSVDVAVGLLGVLKAGGACVPLDPAYPKERLAFMLADAKPKVLLTREHLLSGLPEQTSDVICLDGGQSPIPRPLPHGEGGTRGDRACPLAEESAEGPAPTAGPDDLAYIIYTSGSTGRPRGTMLTHRGLVNHHAAAVALYGLHPGDRVLQFSSLSFDIAVEEIFPTWFAGATVVFRPEELPVTGKEFVEWLAREGITVLDLPTAYWHEWVGDLSQSPCELPHNLRLVIVGGEKARAGALATWQEIAGSRVRWLNTYGPTETSIVATAYEPGPGEQCPEVPIGRPIANTQVYVLDRHGSPVPIGVPGELYIGGDGLARGYLNRPELTAERFVDGLEMRAFDTHLSNRLYRTGDLVRWRSDGNLEFLGRTDHQVKIRGFRIEPGEVEAVLSAHADVREAAVVAREDGRGEMRLVAYVVPQGEASEQELGAFLRAKLPAYMVPSAFMFLDAVPLTPNGKLDRNALPEPQWGRGTNEEGFVAPRSPVEEVVAQVWMDVLRLERVGVHDSFFDLGGHSLVATQVISRVRAGFGIDLPLRVLFEAPTVAGLSEAILEWAARSEADEDPRVDEEGTV